MPRSSSLVPTRPRPHTAGCPRRALLPLCFANNLSFNTLRNPTLSNTAANVIASAVKPDTLRCQQWAVTEFTTWADDMGLKPDEVFPATEAILVEFTTSFCSHLTGGTVKAKISALHTWHLSLGFPWKGGDLLCCTLTSIEHQAPTSSQHPKRPTITHDMMCSLHVVFSSSN
ncbi:hypothetical protein D9758_017380 [Tetrapyrgos nigripes]|uniref:Uncharacterized protein n=1 Tax=Tetrapyrgos nigripes TaxID=182062 RepID=A0A8H5FFU7_9AGAR|nr:hypothetical protein D9758_017380 [Tetrapyrgos nigripes]